MTKKYLKLLYFGQFGVIGKKILLNWFNPFVMNMSEKLRTTESAYDALLSTHSSLIIGPHFHWKSWWRVWVVFQKYWWGCKNGKALPIVFYLFFTIFQKFLGGGGGGPILFPPFTKPLSMLAFFVWFNVNDEREKTSDIGRYAVELQHPKVSFVRSRQSMKGLIGRIVKLFSELFFWQIVVPLIFPVLICSLNFK